MNQTIKSLDDLLAKRGEQYGDFRGHARITQNLKSVMTDTPNWPELSPPMREALEMVAHKLGRILNGNPYHLDSWVDICGYTQLVVDILRKPDYARANGTLLGTEETPLPSGEPRQCNCGICRSDRSAASGLSSVPHSGYVDD